MALYIERRFEATHAGWKILSVECAKCSCQYFFRLTRVGTGSAPAPFFLGQSAAADSSADQAKNELDDRLSFEAELVPCPKCHWINEELVEGYRQSQYRRIGPWALGIAFFGSISSWIGAWFVWNGPRIDHKSLPFFLVYLPLLFVVVAALMFLGRFAARRLIQPNASFPMPPRVPEGTPSAMLVNERTNELETVEQPNSGIKKRFVNFQLGVDSFGPQCCDCLGEAQVGCEYDLPVAGGLELKVPRCDLCAKKTFRSVLGLGLIFMSLMMLCGAMGCYWMELDQLGWWFSLILWGIVSYVVSALAAAILCDPVRILKFDMSRGTLRLKFRNPEFQPQDQRLETEVR